MRFNVNEIYKIKEAAEILKCSYMTMYKLVKDGEVKAFRVGADFRIKGEHLIEYMNKEL